MKYWRKIGLGVVALGMVSSCKSIDAKYCSKNPQSSMSKGSIEVSNVSNKESNVDIESAFGASAEEPFVCLLTGPEQAERKKALQNEIFSQVKKIEEIETGYIFYFEYDSEFLIKMTDYVIAENNCCPFFTFETKLHSKDDVRLKIISSSKEAKEMIKMTLIDNK